MAARYWKCGRTRFWYSTQRREIFGRYYYQCWRTVITGSLPNKTEREVPHSRHNFKKLKTAKARAYQWFSSAARASHLAADLKSDNKAQRAAALRTRAENLRKQGRELDAANEELISMALEAEAQKEREIVVAMQQAAKVAESREDQLRELCHAAALQQRHQAEKKEAARQQKIERLHASHKRWTTKYKLASTKLKKISRALKRLEKR